jgi:hypothetical protein
MTYEEIEVRLSVHRWFGRDSDWCIITLSRKSSLKIMQVYVSNALCVELYERSESDKFSQLHSATRTNTTIDIEGENRIGTWLSGSSR